jgi:hypothetical protein
MKTEKLRSVLALDLVKSHSENGPRVFAAGPITRQPGTNPYRIVLADTGSQLVVWTETFQPDAFDASHDDLAAACSRVSSSPDASSFDHGNYFQADQLVEAMKKFAQRVNNNADFAESVYRLVPEE